MKTNSHAPISPRLLKHPDVLLATGFGSGLSPLAPGTLGSAVACLLFLFLHDTTWPLLFVCCVGFGLGVMLCDKTSKRLGVHDHSGIVWDEFIGMWLAMLWLPLSALSFGIAFLLFRAFDVIKPWPIGVLDKRVHGGFGIMIDDVIAGVFANLCTHLILAMI